jgi:uncharacterized protein
MVYQEINQGLQQIHASMLAAEAHGVAVGLLVVEPNLEADSWLQGLDVISSENNSESTALLFQWFESIRKQLSEGIEEFSFDIFVPDEDTYLDEQAEALREWCQGFLWALAANESSQDWPEEISEIISDIIEFTKLDSRLAEDNNEDDYALQEIREYLRAAVFVIRDYFLEQSPRTYQYRNQE